jgi:chromosome segregation ATPase
MQPSAANEPLFVPLSSSEARLQAAESRCAQKEALAKEVLLLADELQSKFDGERALRLEAEAALRLERAAASEREQRWEERLERQRRDFSATQAEPGTAQPAVSDEQLRAAAAAADARASRAESAASRAEARCAAALSQLASATQRADAALASCELLQADAAATGATLAARSGEVQSLRRELAGNAALWERRRSDAQRSFDARLAQAEAERGALAARLAEAESCAALAQAAMLEIESLKGELATLRDAAGAAVPAAQALAEASGARDAAESALETTAAHVRSLEVQLQRSACALEAAQEEAAAERRRSRASLASLGEQLSLASRLQRSASEADWPEAAQLALTEERGRCAEHRAEAERWREEAAGAAKALSAARAELAGAEAATEVRLRDAFAAAARGRAALEASAADWERLAGVRLRQVAELEERLGEAGAELESLRTKLPTALAGLEGVDVLYLRNVCIELMKASARRDARSVATLLPVVATMLQMSRTEFRALSEMLCSARDDGAGDEVLGHIRVGGYTLRL